MKLSDYQAQAAAKYAARQYTNDPVTLALGLCEEAGEIGKAVNMFHNPLFKPKAGATSDSVEHEMKNLLVYLAALANSLGINLEDL